MTALANPGRRRLRHLATAGIAAARPFVPQRRALVPAFFVALGVLAALWFAMWLQLETPFWAGSTVVITFQATRGQSLLKGANRLVGTLIGATAGVGLIAIFPQQWWGYVLLHTLWLVSCTAVACWLTKARAYAAALSGYTALIVAFDSFGTPLDAFGTAVSRASSICTGLLVFTLIARVMEPSHDAAALRHTLQGWRRDGLALLDDLLNGNRDHDRLAHYLVRLSDLDELLEEGTTEAAWVGQAKPALRSGVLALCDALMLAACMPNGGDPRREAPGSLARDDLVGPEAAVLPAKIAAQVAEATASLSVLQSPHRLRTGRRLGRAVDHDRRIVVRGVLRSTGCFGLACACWIVTHWPAGATFASIAGIICGLFSFQPAAVTGTRKFVIGVIASALLATWIGLFVLPDIDAFSALALILFPFLLIGAAGVRTPALSGYTAPFNLLFLALMGIRNVMSYDALSFFNSIEATVAGALWAAFWFRLCPPLSREERRVGLRRRLREGRTQRPADLHADAARRLLYLQRLGQLLSLSDPVQTRAALDEALQLWRPAAYSPS